MLQAFNQKMEIFPSYVRKGPPYAVDRKKWALNVKRLSLIDLGLWTLLFKFKLYKT